MKITLFIGYLSGGGAERVAVNLAGFLNSKGHDVTVLTYDNMASAYEIPQGVKREFIFKKRRKPNFFDNVMMKLRSTGLDFLICEKFFRTHKTDCYIVMLRNPTIDILTHADRVKCPIIVSERNYPESYSEEIKAKLKSLSKRADGYVLQTEFVRKWYGLDKDNSIVIPNAINKEFLDIKPFKGERRKAIVTAGRLVAAKNHELLIKAFAKAGLNDYVLEIYGEGQTLDSLTVLAEQCGVKDRVIFKGFSKNIKEDIRDASLFVLSSDFEGLPNALIEAMAIGLPCITTDFDGGGARELICDGKEGVIVPKGDEDSLSAAIKKVVGDKSLSETLAENAVAKVGNFSPEKIYSMWEDYIFKICDQKGKRRRDCR